MLGRDPAAQRALGKREKLKGCKIPGGEDANNKKILARNQTDVSLGDRGNAKSLNPFKSNYRHIQKIKYFPTQRLNFLPFNPIHILVLLTFFMLFLGIANTMISYQEYNLDAVKEAETFWYIAALCPHEIIIHMYNIRYWPEQLVKLYFLWIFVVSPELSLSSNKPHTLPHHPCQPNIACASSSLTPPTHSPHPLLMNVWAKKAHALLATLQLNWARQLSLHFA